METKPFHLQAPEQIAKDYDGNKQKIAQASHLGLLDPTAALLAGMFIDRMRSAAMKEQGPPQTVAQQVFAPTAPPAPAPMGGPGGPPPMPPMGGPPPAPGPGGPPPPQMNAPQGMAQGGLASLPVPDSMYDEPVDAQSFRGGGIVAFADGGQFVDMATLDATDRLGNAMNPGGGLEAIVPKLTPAQQETKDLADDQAAIKHQETLLGAVPHKYSDMRAQMYDSEHTPEALAAQKKYDLWSAVGQFGAALGASKSPSLMTAFTEAAGATLPGMAKTRADRIAREHDAIKELATNEDTTRTQKIQMIASAFALRHQNATTDLERQKIAAEVKKAEYEHEYRQGELTQQFNALTQKTESDREKNRIDAITAGAAVTRANAAKPDPFNNQVINANYNIALLANNKLPFYTPGAAPGTYQKKPEAVYDTVVSDLFKQIHQGRPGSTPFSGVGGEGNGDSPSWSVGAPQ